MSINDEDIADIAILPIKMIESAEDYAICCYHIAKIKDMQKVISATFDPIIAKANEARKEAVSQCKRYLQPLLDAEIALKGTMSLYTQSLPTNPSNETVSTRESWGFEITDFLLIPREYLTVNEQAIKSVIRQLKNETNIPGVKPICKATIIVKG